MHTQIITKDYILKRKINQRVKFKKDHVFSRQRYTFDFKYKLRKE